MNDANASGDPAMHDGEAWTRTPTYDWETHDVRDTE